MTELLRLENVSFDGLANGLDLHICTGKVFVIRVPGERECRHLTQILLAERLCDAGELYFNGVSITESNYSQLAILRRQIGLVTAQSGLISNLKLWENITLPLLYHQGSISDQSAEQALQLLDELGYNGNLWALPGHLATHERVIATFVRGVISSSRIMLYTDAVQELPYATKFRMHQTITRIHSGEQAPAAVFITSSDEPFSFIPPDIELDLRDRGCGQPEPVRGTND